MTADLRDDLDRAIDEALSAAVAGEPRRVDAASVRQALTQRRRSPVALWLGLAAALVIAGGGVVFLRMAVEPGSSTDASMPGASGSRAETRGADAPGIAIDAEPTRLAVAPRSRPRPVKGATESSPDRTTEPPFEGLPRLTISPLNLPDSLSPRELQDRALAIPAIEISPLTLAGLSNEPER